MRFWFKSNNVTWKLDKRSRESRSGSGRSRLIDLLNSEKPQQKRFRTIKLNLIDSLHSEKLQQSCFGTIKSSAERQRAGMGLKDTKRCFNRAGIQRAARRGRNGVPNEEKSQPGK